MCIKDKRCYFKSKPNGMTIEKCKRYCIEKGWAVAGVENANQCFCGDKTPTEVIANSKCDHPCSGNSKQFCGGNWAMNIFRLQGELFIFLCVFYNCEHSH